MKTAISIPDPVFKAAETLAHRLGVSRSELYAKAVEAFVKEYRHQGVTNKLNEIYALESGSLESEYSKLQEQSIEQEGW